MESRKRHQMRHLDVLYRLLRGQGVGGSNPFAPTTFKILPVIGLRYLFSAAFSEVLLTTCGPP
jgi:hypothetical protein